MEQQYRLTWVAYSVVGWILDKPIPTQYAAFFNSPCTPDSAITRMLVGPTANIVALKEFARTVANHSYWFVPGLIFGYRNPTGVLVGGLRLGVVMCATFLLFVILQDALHGSFRYTSHQSDMYGPTPITDLLNFLPVIAGYALSSALGSIISQSNRARQADH
jgi:hypothetical protein